MNYIGLSVNHCGIFPVAQLCPALHKRNAKRCAGLVRFGSYSISIILLGILSGCDRRLWGARI
jgi:hypothetical protein